MKHAKRLRKLTGYIVGAASLALMSMPAQAALVFNFTFVAGTSAQAQQAFVNAGARWSSLFTDNVTLDMTVGQSSLGTGILASTGSRRGTVSYDAFKAALASDATSATDAAAVANLQTGSSFGMLINRTSDNPNGVVSATPYLDTTGANNSNIRLTTANAKALGFGVG